MAGRPLGSPHASMRALCERRIQKTHVCAQLIRERGGSQVLRVLSLLLHPFSLDRGVLRRASAARVPRASGHLHHNSALKNVPKGRRYSTFPDGGTGGESWVHGAGRGQGRRRGVT